MKKLTFLFTILLLCLSNIVRAQSFKEYALNKPWILLTDADVTKDKVIKFTNFDKSKLNINNMIWTFLPYGKIEYDYQSADDVDACAGVDFLDLDIDESIWRFDDATNVITLTMKGGYSSIDDFVVRKEFDVQHLKEEANEYIILTEKRLIFFNDLTRFKNK